MTELSGPVPFEEGNEINETRSVESSEENVRLHTPPLTFDIPSLPQNIEASITGAGCAVIQVSGRSISSSINS